MNKQELDKITEHVLSLLREKGVSISNSGSPKVEAVNSDVLAADGESPFKMDPMLIPLHVTERAVMLTKADREKLFGTAELAKDPVLSGGERVIFDKTVTVSGPDGDIEGVHVGASDSKSQVELLSGDNSVLGVSAPLRLSGDTESTPGLSIVGPSGKLELEEGAIIPMRKISLDPAHAEHYGVIEGQVVSVEVSGSRGGLLVNVAVVIGEGMTPVCFIDRNEADAMCASEAAMVKIVK